jgi:hypothetical protein
MTKEPPALMKVEARQKRILDADYSKVDLKEFTSELSHLNASEQTMLHNVLYKYDTLFGGGLGTLDVKPVHLELKDDAKPYHSPAFPVPQAYSKTTKKEINCFCDIGVMKKSHNSEWAAPTFIQPKKTGDVQVLTES